MSENKNPTNKTRFVRIKKKDIYVEMLYKLLGMRKYNISNRVLPKYSDHKNFVINHPYRAWYLVYNNNDCVGTVYLMKNNCISVNVLSDDIEVFHASIKWIVNKFKPLPEIKSVRQKNFNINISPDNLKLIKAVSKIGAIQIQLTYELPLHLK